MTFRTSLIVPVGVGLLAVVAIVLLNATAAESTHVVRLSGNRFTPGEVTVRAGDSLRFVNGGGFHNIAFREDILSPSQRRLLDSVMPGREEFRKFGEVPLASPLLITTDEVYALQLPALPPGRYEYFCAPHVGAGMKGTVVVVP
ncbi:MAG TPA: plastocyanin/azurin family copper-binding protein [Gemmatimonadaceae bacterium]